MSVVTPTRFEMSHSTRVEAAAESAWALINDVSRWPDVFPPCQAAREVAVDGNEITIEVTATVGDSVRTWQSKRRVHPEIKKVEFFQTNPYPPMAAMDGYWQVEELEANACEVVLFHGFEITEETAAAGDPPRSIAEAKDWLHAACDKNSKVELESFKTACE